MALSQSVQQQQVGLYLDNVKSVGFELRKLLEAVDQLVPALPTNTHREVSERDFFSGFFLSSRFVRCIRFYLPWTQTVFRYIPFGKIFPYIGPSLE